MNCSHNRDAGHNQMDWYKQRPGESMTIVVYTSVGKPVNQTKYSAIKDNIESGALTVKNLQPEDSAVYFCAVSKHSGVKSVYLSGNIQVFQTPRDLLVNPYTEVKISSLAHCSVKHFKGKMIPSITTLTIFVLWAAGVSQCVLITQWPRNIVRHPGISAEMHCYQNDTDYEYLYWYRQLRGNQIQMMVYIVAGSPTFAEGFKSGYKALRVQQKQWSLEINSTQYFLHMRVPTMEPIPADMGRQAGSRWRDRAYSTNITLLQPCSYLI
ncbi:T-cell receptor beta, type 1 [Solea senegalensis]|nr:T-cell receptor beta, type 1 [Solea senegalensis]